MKLAANHKKTMKHILVVVLVLTVVAGIVTLNQAVKGGCFDELYYEIESKDCKLEYALVEVLRERDEPPVYKVDINGKTVSVSEDIWENYLGNEYNTITCRTETVSICKFNASGTYQFLKFSRSNYPWEGPAKPYSEAEIETLLRDIYKQQCWSRPFHPGNRLFQSETTVKFDVSVIGHGAEKAPYVGKTEIEHPKINWWFLSND